MSIVLSGLYRHSTICIHRTMILIHISKKNFDKKKPIGFDWVLEIMDWPTLVNFNIIAQETSTMGINAVIYISCML